MNSIQQINKSPNHQILRGVSPQILQIITEKVVSDGFMWFHVVSGCLNSIQEINKSTNSSAPFTQSTNQQILQLHSPNQQINKSTNQQILQLHSPNQQINKSTNQQILRDECHKIHKIPLFIKTNSFLKHHFDASLYKTSQAYHCTAGIYRQYSHGTGLCRAKTSSCRALSMP